MTDKMFKMFRFVGNTINVVNHRNNHHRIIINIIRNESFSSQKNKSHFAPFHPFFFFVPAHIFFFILFRLSYIQTNMMHSFAVEKKNVWIEIVQPKFLFKNRDHCLRKYRILFFSSKANIFFSLCNILHRTIWNKEM